ncbi:hypothetical protein C5S31_10185 [ANME-1 cluster archaeon GoMg2]|nr:hypothetical protein [ANME-1 cluster archaeon GoMg2]
MTKVTLDLPRGEIVRILSQLSLEEREEIMGEAGKERGVLEPKFISIEEILKLKGLISVGGDALIDLEGSTMNELIFNKDFDEIDWLKRVDGETIL